MAPSEILKTPHMLREFIYYFTFNFLAPPLLCPRAQVYLLWYPVTSQELRIQLKEN